MSAEPDLIWVLRTSVDEWNARRFTAHEAPPSLADADLTGCDLSGADLSGVDLSNARLADSDLAGANLTDATLRGAFLAKASLIGARAQNADLERANLREANLENANLSGCNLRDAVLLGTNLRGADLTGCKVRRSELLMADSEHARLDAIIDLDEHRRANETLDDSSNIMLRILARDEEESVVGDEPGVTKRAVALATLGLLALCGLTACAVWDIFAQGLYSVAPFVWIGLIVAMALLPQVAYLFPRRWLPYVGIAASLLCGCVTGGFATFGGLLSHTVVAQSLLTIGVGVVLVMALSWSSLKQIPDWGATAIVVASALGSSAVIFSLAGAPWVIPFVAEHGVYPPFPAELGPEWIHGDALWMRLGMFGLLVLVAIAVRQAVRDWRIVEERIEKGLGKRMLWCAAAVLVGIVPMAGLYVFLGSKSPKVREPPGRGT